MTTTTTTPPKTLKLLIAGLTVHATIPPYLRTLYGTPSEIQSAITADEHRIRAAGVDVTSYQIDDADAETGLQWVESTLRGERFDGVIVGSGLRLVPDQTALFERVVGVCVREGRGAVLMFNEGPGTNWDALRRNGGRLGWSA